MSVDSYLHYSVLCLGDIESGKKVFEFRGKRVGKKPVSGIKGLTGHLGHVLSIAVSNDGRFLASVGNDKILKIWDTHNNELIDDFKGHRDVIAVGAFT